MNNESDLNRGLSVVPHFEITPAEAQARMAEFVAYVKAQMVEGSDYGVIPGTAGSKPTLLKPGAEKLCNLFGLTIEQTVTQRVERWEDPGLFVYEVSTTLRSMRTGVVVAHGLGSCNSKESRYRWRQGQRLCPHCGKDAIIKGRAEYAKGQKGHEQGGWLCFAKRGGCGAKFADADQTILGQSVERVENPDLFDVVNTILKMAGKRSLVDAVLKATRASGLFTQDLEDGSGVVEGEVVASASRAGRTLGTDSDSERAWKDSHEDPAATPRPARRVTVAAPEAAPEAPPTVDWLGHINAAMTAAELGVTYREACRVVPPGIERTALHQATIARKALMDSGAGYGEPPAGLDSPAPPFPDHAPEPAGAPS